MSLVSVIIPTYNSADTIEKAVQSVLQQDYEPVEIIVIDDGSTDDTQNVLKDYIKNKNIIYCWQVNGGPGSARNKGIDMANGDFICFLDSDDQLLPGSLSKRVYLFKKFFFLNIVISDLNRIYKDGSKTLNFFKKNDFISKFSPAIIEHTKKEYIFSNLFIRQGIIHDPMIKTPTVMIRSEILQKVGKFREDIKIAEDFDLWFRIIQFGGIGYIDEALTDWNNHEGSLTDQTDLYYTDLIRFYKTLKKYCDKTMYKHLKKKLSFLFFCHGYFFFQQQKMVEAREKIIESLKYNCFNYNGYMYLILSYLPNGMIEKIRFIKSSILRFMIKNIS